MKLAVFVTPEQPVPPPNYGGAERHCDILVRELMNNGHEVDLYAAKGSTCPATRVFESRELSMAEEAYLVAEMAKQEYDCIIDMTAHHLAGQNAPRVVSVMAGDPFKRYPHDQVKNKVYVSREFAWFNESFFNPVVYNLVERIPENVPLGNGQGGHGLFVGPIHRMKGIHLAAEACKMAGIPLHVYGPIRDEEYWDAVWPMKHVEHKGMLGNDGRDEVFGDAKVFFHLTQCVDADPLAPKEAMLRGTPVIACPSGGVCSSVVQGVTGYFGNNIKTIAELTYKVGFLDRVLIRKEIIHKVNVDRLVARMENLCFRAMIGEQW